MTEQTKHLADPEKATCSSRCGESGPIASLVERSTCGMCLADFGRDCLFEFLDAAVQLGRVDRVSGIAELGQTIRELTRALEDMAEK